jgi:recombination protein RecT
MTNEQQKNESTEIATVSTLGAFYERIQKILGDSRKALSEVLPPSISVERHLRTALTLWRTDEKIQKCDPPSFAGVVMESAQLHLSLDPNLGQAYIVPRYDRKKRASFASLLVGYPGLVKLARDSGQVVDFTAMLVRDGDDFDFALGTAKFLRHSWKLDAARGKVVGGYLFVKLTSGEQHLFLMTAAQLVEARDRVLAENGIRVEVDEDGVEHGFKKGEHGDYEVDSPWISDPEPMWVKTLIRRGSKTIPLGDGYTRAVALDEAQDLDKAQNLSENLRGILPEASLAPAAADDKRAQEATNKAAEDLAARIKAKAEKEAAEAADRERRNAEEQDRARAAAEPEPAKTVPATEDAPSAPPAAESSSEPEPVPAAPVEAPAVVPEPEPEDAAQTMLREQQEKLDKIKAAKAAAKKTGGRKARSEVAPAVPADPPTFNGPTEAPPAAPALPAEPDLMEKTGETTDEQGNIVF